MGATLKIEITQGEQDKLNLKTYITVKVKVTATGSTYNGYDSQCDGSLSGTFTGSWSKGFGQNKTTTLYTKSGWVQHDKQGKCTVSFSAIYDTGVSPGTIRASASKTLTQLPTIKVYYMDNGGSGSPSEQDKYYGVDLTLSSTKPTRYGYDFMGWGISSIDTSVDYSPGATFSEDANNVRHLYAIWKKNISLYYNANNGENAPPTQIATIYNATTNYTFTTSTNVPTRTGYDFLGWSTNATATKPSYQGGYPLTLSDTTTLYAVWQLKTYSITFNANGGNNPPSVITKSYGINIKIPTIEPTRSGYKFLGWSTNSIAKTPTYLVGSTFTNNANTTLYAVWEQLGIAYINVNGTFQAGKVWVNNYGTWETGIIFVNDHGTWTQGGI